MSTGGDYCGPQFIFMMIYIQRIYIFVEYLCVCLCTVQCCRYPDWREAASDDRHLGLHTTEEPMSSTCTSRCLKSWLKNTGLLNWMFWGLFNILMMIKIFVSIFSIPKYQPKCFKYFKNCRFHHPPPQHIAGSIYKFNRPCLKLELQLIANW